MANVEKALVTERGVSGNDNVAEVVTDIVRAYRPQNPVNDIETFRINHTAMVPNDRNVYAYDSEGKPFILFRAGWYLSAEENFIKEKLLSEEDTAQMNEAILSAMERNGKVVKKKPAAPRDVRVVG